MVAVRRGRGSLAQVDQTRLHALLAAREFLVLTQGLLGWVEHEQPMITVEKHLHARHQARADVMQADDGGDVQRPRHDGGVRRAAARVRGEAEHQFRFNNAVSDGVRFWARRMCG